MITDQFSLMNKKIKYKFILLAFIVCLTIFLLKSDFTNNLLINIISRHNDTINYPVQLKKYHKPVVEIDSKSITISGKNKPAGLFFNYTINPQKRYRIIIDGHTQYGNVKLRIRNDKHKLEYWLDQDGVNEFFYDDVNQVEFLFYSDKTFSYSLNSIIIEELPTGKTDNDLRKLLLTEIPGLKKALNNAPLDAARLIMNWVANVGDFATSNEINQITVPTVAKSSASEIYYDIFLPNKGGVYCGGYSIFLNKVLRIFNYKSFTIDFGDKQTMTHVVVIIPQKQSKGYKYYLFDPTFNITFRHRKTGKYVPFTEIINLYKNHKTNQLLVDSMSLNQRDWLYLKKDEKHCDRLKVISPDYLICSRPDYSIKHFLDYYASTFEKNDYKAGIEGYLQLLTTHFFAITHSTNKEINNDFIGKIKSFQIPYK